MVALRRTPRTVYRVYEEQEYLAGTDALSGWDISSPPRVSRELLFRRIAGVAALTGAVGTLGGLIVADVLPARQADLQIADHGVPPRAARPVKGPSVSVRPGEALPSEHTGKERRVAAAGRRTSTDRVRAIREKASAEVMGVASVQPGIGPERAPARGLAPGAIGSGQDGRAEATMTQATRNEFGFER